MKIYLIDTIDELSQEGHLDTRALEKLRVDVRERIEARNEDEDDNDEYDDEYEGWVLLLELLDTLADEISEWNDGTTLISEQEWADYAQEWAEDSGTIKTSDTMANYIDWDRWAEDMKQDFSRTEIGNTVYYYRD